LASSLRRETAFSVLGLRGGEQSAVGRQTAKLVIPKIRGQSLKSFVLFGSQRE